MSSGGCSVTPGYASREVPAVQHGDPVADVAHRDREVDRRVGDLATPRRPGPEPAVVEEADLLRRSSSRDGASSGRSPASSERSAARAARFADRTDTNVAIASTSVAPAVTIPETATQSVATITAAP